MTNPHASVVPLSAMTIYDMLRFWSNVDMSGDCWTWIAHRDRKGYGRFSFKDSPRIASRVSWFLHSGEMEGNKLICHTCDNPPCVRPDHLFLGTSKDNITDAIKKGRINVTGSNNPFAKLTEEKADEIRLKFKPHIYMVKTLAKEYGVSIGTIESIIYRTRWNHPPNEAASALGKITTEKKIAANRERAKLPRKPVCKSCLHKLSDHQFHTSRNRGHCLLCDCKQYRPDVKTPKPVSKIIGRLNYKK